MKLSVTSQVLTVPKKAVQCSAGQGSDGFSSKDVDVDLGSLFLPFFPVAGNKRQDDMDERQCQCQCQRTRQSERGL